MKISVCLRIVPLVVLLSTLHLLPSLAHAASADCGEYREDDGDRSLILDDARNARLTHPRMAPKHLQYRRENGRLAAFDLDVGVPDEYAISADGTRLVSNFGSSYTLAQPRACAATPTATPPAGSCRADLEQCAARLDQSDSATVARWCEEDLPFACVALIRRYQTQAIYRAHNLEIADTTAPACRKDSHEYSEADCADLMEEQAEQALPALASSLFGASIAYSAAHLDWMTKVCERRPSAAVCGEAATNLWDGHRHAAARDALVLACDRGQDPGACRRAAPLRELSAALLKPVSTSHLPCGDYAAVAGVMNKLSFGDHGMVESNHGEPLQGSIQDGAILLGEAGFEFRALANGDLIGQDLRNHFALYRRQGGPTHCVAPSID